MAESRAKVDPRARAAWMVKLGVRSGSKASIAFGEALRALRAEAGLTQKQAAVKAKVSDSIWATWETGKGLPGEQSWRALVRAYGQGTDRLIEAMTVAAAAPGAGEPLAAKVKKPPAPKMVWPVDPEPEWRAQRGMPPVEENVVRGADTDGVIGAVLACGLGDREKALLCAAVVAMAAGVGVEVEIRARV